MTLNTTQKVPLEKWQDGTIRVKNTNLLVDVIIDSHNQGDIPEVIAESFPAVSVADVYTIIAYYLNNKQKLDNYLENQEREAKKLKERLESLPGYKERQRKLDELLEKTKKRT